MALNVDSGLHDFLYKHSSKGNGIKVMTGFLEGSALGISAGLHFALSYPNIEYVDPGVHLDPVEDPFLYFC